VQPELALRDSSHLLIALFGVGRIAISLVSMWKENRQQEPLSGIISFALPMVGVCVFVLLEEYVQKARSLEKVSHRIEAVWLPSQNS
jgi:hypothetical protein